MLRAAVVVTLFCPSSHMLSSRLGVGDGAHLLDYDSDEVDKQYEVMTLHIIHRRRCTGFEESKDFPVRHNDVIAGRYRVRLRRSHDEQHIAFNTLRSGRTCGHA